MIRAELGSRGREAPVGLLRSNEEHTMSETTTTTERLVHKELFPTLADAQAVKPGSDKLRVFEVFKGAASVGFTWGSNVNDAIVTAARADGFAAKAADGKAPVTKERVAERLAEFTDEELAAMGLSRKKAKK